MAINLRNNVQKQKLPLSNPIASFQNPVEDFLTPFQQTKKDLEGKIAEISSGQAPKSISQDINETNWSQFQGDSPDKPNYQPQSLIDYFRTGKTSSERIASGEIPSRQVPDSENPFKTPTKSTNPYEGAPGFVQSVGNFMFGTNPDDPTTSGLYKTAETIQGAGQAIFENQVEGGKQIADIAMQHSQNALNRGYSDLSPEKEAKIKDYIRQKLDAGVSPDIIKEALAKAKSEGKLQGSWLDNPISGTLATIESGLSKGIAGLETGISNMGSAPIQEDATSGLTRLTKGALETGLGSAQLATSVMPTAMGAKALIAPTVNTLFSTETAENVISPITEGIGTGIGMGQEALGYNPESSVSKDIQGIGSTAGTIALLGGAQKGGSKLYDYSAGKLSKGMESMYKRTGKKIPEQKPPVMDEGNNAISSEGVQGEIQSPGIIAGVQDKIFGDKNNVNLAGRAVSPRSTKQKSPNQKAEGDTKAYEGLQQLHDDSIAGRVDTDIGTMKGGAEGIEQGLDFWGKKIGEYTESDAKVPVTDIVGKLGEHMQNPLSNLSGPVKSIADAIIKVFSDPTYKDGMTISDIQQAMSDIKSQIYSDHKLVQALSRETAGRGVNDFINTLNDRFQKAIDETSGNSIELQRAKQAYSRYKQIQGDFMQSLLVNNRNSKTGATGKAGIILGLYELSKGGAAAIPKVLALKYITGKMGEYGTRSGAYEKLIRNMDRQALQRAKGKYNTGDKSTINLNNKKNDSGNSSNPDSTVPPEGTFQGGVEKVIQKQEGTTAVIEKPKTEVKVEQKPEAKRLLPKPKAEEVAKKVEQQSLNIEEKPAVKKEIIPKPKPKVYEVVSKKETSEIETLPKEISTYDEGKVVGPKRIAPDRVAHQQLTPEEGITKLVEKLKEKREKNSKYFGDALVKMDAIMEKYGTSLPARTEANLKKYPTLKEDTAFKKSLEQYAHTGTSFKNIRDRMEYLKDYWKFDESKMEQYREAMAKDYVKNVKDDISKGYKYPDEVLAYDKSFKTAVNSRERYEKGLRTSFGVDDARIVFDEVDKIGAGMKRQDGKAITPEQIADIKKGVTDFAEVFDLDMKRIANNERWVYVHLNGKNPFLKTNASGLYRPDAKAGGVSISVGGDETVTIMKDGKMEVKKTHTTMAHELGHALDFQVKRKLFDSSFIFDRKLDMNKATDGGSWYSKYLRKPEEIVARMIEQYVGIKKGNEAYYEKSGFWKKSVFDSIEKDIEKAINTHYGEYKNSKEKK